MEADLPLPERVHVSTRPSVPRLVLVLLSVAAVLISGGVWESLRVAHTANEASTEQLARANASVDLAVGRLGCLSGLNAEVDGISRQLSIATAQAIALAADDPGREPVLAKLLDLADKLGQALPIRERAAAAVGRGEMPEQCTLKPPPAKS